MLTAMQFQVGEKIRGNESGAEYVILSVDYNQPNDYPNDEYNANQYNDCLLYTSPSPRDYAASRMPSSA